MLHVSWRRSVKLCSRVVPLACASVTAPAASTIPALFGISCGVWRVENLFGVPPVACYTARQGSEASIAGSCCCTKCGSHAKYDLPSFRFPPVARISQRRRIAPCRLRRMPTAARCTRSTCWRGRRSRAPGRRCRSGRTRSTPPALRSPTTT